jgi:hypothetical protein
MSYNSWELFSKRPPGWPPSLDRIVGTLFPEIEQLDDVVLEQQELPDDEVFKAVESR